MRVGEVRGSGNRDEGWRGWVIKDGVIKVGGEGKG